MKIGVWPVAEHPEISGDQPLDGMTFVITGTLPNLSRMQAKDLIQSNGGKVTGSVSSKTTYLVLGESPGSKFADAQKLNVPTLNEGGLIRLIESKDS